MTGYDITQVNVPGILGAYTGAQDRRLNQMLAKRKMDMEDQKLAKEERLTSIYKNLRAPGTEGGGQPSSGGLAAPYAPPGVAGPVESPVSVPIAASFAAPTPDGIDRNRPVGSPLSPAVIPDAPAASVAGPAPIAPPQSMAGASAPTTPPPQSWVDANKPMLDQLMTVDPPQAFALRNQLATLDKEQLAKVQANSEMFGKIAEHLQSFTSPAARLAEIQRLRPQLIAEGIPPERIDSFDVSDKNLQWLYVHASDLDKVISREKDDRTFAETVRHNRATEGVASGNLAVREGALGLAKGREGRIASGGGKGGSNTSGMSNDAILGNLLGR